MLTKPDRGRGEGDHLWPEFLPGGKAVLFTITPANGSLENAHIAVLDLQSGTSKVLSVEAATRTMCRRGISSTVSQGLCVPWHSTLTAGGRRDACAGTRWGGDDLLRGR